MARRNDETSGDILHTAPQSLRAGANRLHFDRVVELFIRIRRDCDAAAAELGLTSKDDGLAAVQFLADAILDAVHREREKQSRAVQPRRKSGQHESTKRFKEDWDATYSRELKYQRATPATLTKWIDELENALRVGRTKSGKPISALEAKEIRAYRARLSDRRSSLEQKKPKKPTKGEVKSKLAQQFVDTGFYGKPRGDQDALNYISEKRKRAGRGIRKGKQKPARG